LLVTPFVALTVGGIAHNQSGVVANIIQLRNPRDVAALQLDDDLFFFVQRSRGVNWDLQSQLQEYMCCAPLFAKARLF